MASRNAGTTDAATPKGAAPKMREPVLVPHISGLKCDAKGCDWQDPTVTLAEYPSYLNASCPLCGANVLTVADFKAVVGMLRAAEWANKWLWWLPKRKKPTLIVGNLDGRGKPNFRVEREPRPIREGE